MPIGLFGRVDVVGPMSRFDKIIIIADRDEVGSEDDFIQKLEE